MCKPSAIVSGKDAVDINRGDYSKRTTLHLATGEGHLDMVQYPYKHGANANVKD